MKVASKHIDEIDYRYFGVGSAVAGLLYFCYEFFYAGGFRTWCKQEEKVIVIFFIFEGKIHRDVNK